MINNNETQTLGDNLIQKIYDYEHQYDVDENQEFYFTYEQNYTTNSNLNDYSLSEVESSDNESDLEYY